MSTYIGLDLGQLVDHSALAVVKVDDPPRPPAPIGPVFHPADGRPPHQLTVSGSTWEDARAPVAVATPPRARDLPPHLRLTFLKRWPLGTKYASVVAAMKLFLASPLAGEHPKLIIDGTGVGVAVLEMFDAAGIVYEAVSIHGGQATTRDGRLWRVAKKTLVAALQVPLQNDLLTIEPPTMPYATELQAEMLNFTYKISATAHESFASWRERDHDDLVLALAIASWRATRASRRTWAV